MLKAIETVYKGHRFRSRLEARWAVFFDTLGVRWEYEKEGYDLGPAGWYLPDFWLLNVCWVEVKPRSEWFWSATCEALANQSHECVIYLAGNPWPGEYGACIYREDFCSGSDPLKFATCRKSDKGIWLVHEDAAYEYGCDCDNVKWDESSGRITAAYAAARGARFEHGERP